MPTNTCTVHRVASSGELHLPMGGTVPEPVPTMRPLAGWCAVLCGLVIAAVADADNVFDYRVNWTRGCPPGTYLTPAQKAAVMDGTMANPNPPLDLDLLGNGQKTAWNTPITISTIGGAGSYTTTDENGPNNGTVFLPAIPDPAGSGFGSDHYSPRFRRANVDPTQGIVVGKCVYTLGRNLWTLDFADANGNSKPDRFLKSSWRSRNGDPADPKFNEMTFFVTDFTKDKIEFVRSVQSPPPPMAARAKPAATPFGLSIQDAVVADLGTDPSSVMLGGKPIPDPGPSPSSAGVTQQPEAAGVVQETNSLLEPDLALVPGHLFTVSGTISNTDSVSHTYHFSLFGVDATIDGSPSSILLPPGASQAYQFDATPLGSGTVAVFSLAYSDSGTFGDGTLSSALFTAVPEPSVVLVLAAVGYWRLVHTRVRAADGARR